MTEHPLEYSSVFDLIDKEIIVISDSLNQSTRASSSWYEQFAYDANNFNEMDTSALEQVIEDVAPMVNWWSRQNVMTVPKVAEETENYFKMLLDKLQNLNGRKTARESRKEVKSGRWKKVDCEYESDQSLTYAKEEENRGLFEQITDLQRRIAKKTRGCIYHPRDSRKFAVIEDIVRAVAAHTGAKIDFTLERYASEHPKSGKTKEDRHTDEQLAATALYSAIVQKEPITVVTFDSDIQRLFKRTHHILMHSDFCPAEYLRALAENEIASYFIVQEDKIKKAYDSANMAQGKIVLPPEVVAECEKPMLRRIIKENIDALRKL